MTSKAIPRNAKKIKPKPNISIFDLQKMCHKYNLFLRIFKKDGKCCVRRKQRLNFKVFDMFPENFSRYISRARKY